MRYREYLKSKRWKKQRRRTFHHHGKRCVICGNKKVEVHHLTYKSIGAEDPRKQLLPLCREHHQQVHDLAKAKSMNIWNATHLLTRDYRSTNNPRRLTWDQMTPYQRERYLGRSSRRVYNKHRFHI